MAIKWRPAHPRSSNQSKAIANVERPPAQGVFGDIRFLRPCTATRPAQAQANFDRPGGDYQSSPVPRAIRRIARWCASATSAAGPGASAIRPTAPAARCAGSRATCRRAPWIACCVSGVRGAGVVEPRNGAIETSIDRFGGDYRNFELKSSESDEACKAACTADNKCRAWTYARPGYVGRGGALFSEKRNQAAAAQAGIYLGRGAVGTNSSSDCRHLEEPRATSSTEMEDVDGSRRARKSARSVTMRLLLNAPP